MAKRIIVNLQVKEAAKEAGIPNVSLDFYDELEKKTKSVIEKACLRAKSNGRTTVMGKDV